MNYPFAYLARGYAHAGTGELEKALQDFDKAIELDASYAAAYLWRGHSYFDLGEYEQAIPDYDRAIELDPEMSEAYLYLGHSHDWLGDYEQSIQNYDAAIEIDPDYVYAYYWRGYTHAEYGYVSLAIKDFTTAIELNREWAEPYYMRGSVYAMSGNRMQAIRNYNRAIELDPKLAEAYYRRGIVRAELGDNEQAIQDFERYLALAPDAPNRAEVESWIADLQSEQQEEIEVPASIRELQDAAGTVTTTVYINPDFPWSISVPPGWGIDDPDTSFVSINRSDDDGGFGLCGIHTGAADFTTVDEFVDAVLAHDPEYFKGRGQTFVVLSRQDITLSSGVKGIEVIVEIGPGGKSRRVYMLADGRVYVVDCETYLEDWPKLESVYDQIINSFTLEDSH
jgi:tetratricopeptide (TPR) repeat protein